ncbi:unnamed protein product, partial [Polarella glacialis]
LSLASAAQALQSQGLGLGAAVQEMPEGELQLELMVALENLGTASGIGVTERVTFITFLRLAQAMHNRGEASQKKHGPVGSLLSLRKSELLLVMACLGVLGVASKRYDNSQLSRRAAQLLEVSPDAPLQNVLSIVSFRELCELARSRRRKAQEEVDRSQSADRRAFSKLRIAQLAEGT